MNTSRRNDRPLDDRIMVTRCEPPDETPRASDTNLTNGERGGSEQDANLFSMSRRTTRDTSAESSGAWALRAALTAHDAEECRIQAERAGMARDPDTAELLGILLRPPSGLRMRVKRRQWEQARVAAVRALERIGPEHALPPLARALLDPSPPVQDAAARVLAQAGPAAAPALSAVLYDPGDWSLRGMKRLVETLAQLQTPQAATALVPLVLGGQPPAPRRWESNALISGTLRSGGALVIGSAIVTAIITGDIPMAICMAIAMFFAAAIFGGLFLCLCALPLHVIREGYERNTLASLAAKGLYSSDAKIHLPALIEGAFGCNQMRPDAARLAVLHLLPRLTSEEAAHLPKIARQRLMEALGWRQGAAMDLVVLRVLEWAGNGQVIPRVEGLAKRGETEELRAEAARILPILQERQRSAQAPAMLLRASQAAPATGEQLLRPGYTPDATPAVQLLRPTQEE